MKNIEDYDSVVFRTSKIELEKLTDTRSTRESFWSVVDSLYKFGVNSRDQLTRSTRVGKSLEEHHRLESRCLDSRRSTTSDSRLE